MTGDVDNGLGRRELLGAGMLGLAAAASPALAKGGGRPRPGAGWR